MIEKDLAVKLEVTARVCREFAETYLAADLETQVQQRSVISGLRRELEAELEKRKSRRRRAP